MRSTKRDRGRNWVRNRVPLQEEGEVPTALPLTVERAIAAGMEVVDKLKSYEEWGGLAMDAKQWGQISSEIISMEPDAARKLRH